MRDRSRWGTAIGGATVLADMVNVGSEAPDWPLTGIDGTAVTLSQYWREQPILLVFLRHLGCIFCREQVAILRDRYRDFVDAGVEIVCVAQGDYKTGKAFSLLMDLPYPLLLCGDSVAVYRAYGLMRGTLGQLFGLGSVVRGLRALLGGSRQGGLVGDGFQMPGIFLIDTSGIVRFAHRHRHAGDNPSADVLLAAVGDGLGTAPTPAGGNARVTKR